MFQTKFLFAGNDECNVKIKNMRGSSKNKMELVVQY